MLCSSTAYFIPGKKGCQPKNIISHCRVSSIQAAVLGRLVFIFACWVVGSHTDFLFCLYIPCSLISGISLLSFSCTGEDCKRRRNFSVGVEEAVTEITYSLGLCCPSLPGLRAVFNDAKV